MKPPIILAIDTDNLDVAQRWVEITSPFVSAVKLGLEFYLKFGHHGVRAISSASDSDIFLDLKLHDIPNTVAGAMESITSLTPRFVTVHASGGDEMVKAAVSRAGDIEITAVTILTSLSQRDIEAIGYQGDIEAVATHLARMAVNAGARAIVCSPLEISAIRAGIGDSVHIITPGVRLHAQGDDQKRVMTPSQALNDGADYLVIGRPITGAWSRGEEAMRQAAQEIVESL